MQSWQLERASGTGRVAGVCSGIAARWNIDPFLVRIGAVLLSLWGGLGVVLYGAAWALFPVRGRGDAPLFRAVPSARRVPGPVLLALVAVLAVATMAVSSSVLPVGPGVLVVLAALWYLLVHRRRDRAAGSDRPGPAVPGPATPPTGQASPGAPGSAPTGTEPVGWSDQLPPVVPHAARADHRATADFFSHPDPAGLYAPADADQAGPAVAARTPRHATALARRVRRWGLLAALAAMIVLGLIDAIGPADIPFAAYPSVALLMIGISLVVSAWTGRARGLLPLAIVLLLTTMTGLTASGNGSDTAALADQRVYTTAAELPFDGRDRFEFGSAMIDLRGFTATEDVTYRVSMEAGSVRVLVPAGMRTEVVATAEAGSITLDGHASGSGVDVRRTATYGGGLDGPVLRILVEAETGSIEVRR